MKTIKVISRTAIVVAIMARTLSAQAARPIDEFLFDEPAGFFATNSGSSSVIVPQTGAMPAAPSRRPYKTLSPLTTITSTRSSRLP